jgi:hypothetical protein
MGIGIPASDFGFLYWNLDSGIGIPISVPDFDINVIMSMHCQ